MAKIAILYEILGRSRGGIEAWIYHVTEELLRQGHEVTLFNIQEDTPSDAAPSNVRIVSLRGHFRVKILDFYSQVLNIKLQLKNQLEKFDKVWTRSFTMAWSASKILGSNKVVYINAAPYSFYGQVPFRIKMAKAKGIVDILKAISSELTLKIAYRIERQAIIQCKNVYLSNTRLNETLSFFKLKDKNIKYFVIPAGVNTYRFVPGHLKMKNNDILKIISVCRLAPDKNIQCVIKAVKILKDINIFVESTIVGEGAFENELRKLISDLSIEDRVHLVGRKENIEEWYKKNHVFVLPSLYEGFGSVYVEAMSCGLPCIAISNKSGKYSVAADEIIDDGINGYLLTENDPNELTQCLLKFCKNPKLLTDFGIEARRKTESIFNWGKSVEKLLIL